MGFGSAKTSTCGAEFITLALSTPNGRGLVGAATYPQLEQTSMKQILDMLPSELIESHNKQKNIMTLTNGYEILFRSFDEQQKLRSLNLCHVWIEEANGVDFAIYTQLQTRLRHHACTNHKIIMSTNPDINWVKSEILLKAARIYGAAERYARDPIDINPNISVHIAQTSMNSYLPDDYIDSISVGKPDWWINRYLKGSFQSAEGAVYPQFPSVVLEASDPLANPDTIKANIRRKGWEVVAGYDFGIVDPTVQILGAIDPINGVLYLYDEYYKNRVAVPTHANAMKKRMEHIPLGRIRAMPADPAGKKRNINDTKSIFDHYGEYGLFFKAADNRITTGIMKVYSYLEMGKLKVLPHLSNTIKEMENYRYKPVELGESFDEIPVDKDNHTCDVIRYMCQELPDDPELLKNLSYGNEDFRMVDESQDNLPFELQDNDDGFGSMQEDWYNYY